MCAYGSHIGGVQPQSGQLNRWQRARLNITDHQIGTTVYKGQLGLLPRVYLGIHISLL